MKKVFCIILILFLFVLSACVYEEKEQTTFDEGYEDIEHQIVDTYGKYLTVSMSEESVTLYLRRSYSRYNYSETDMPLYKLVEDLRCMVNDYIFNNPNSTLARNMRLNLMSMNFIEDCGDHHSTIFVIDNYHSITFFREGPKQFFVSYWEGYFSEDYMYDYLSQAGDIVYIPLLKYEDYDNAEWRKETLAKFPLASKYDNKEQEYLDGYIDVLDEITEKYGDKIYTFIYEKDSKIEFKLYVRDSYRNDKKMKEDVPYYMIVEDVRNILNDHIIKPDLRLSLVDGSFEVLFIVDEERYDYILDSYKKITYEDGQSVIAMYEYFSIAGDIVEVPLKFYGLSKEETKAIKKVVKEKIRRAYYY